MSHTLKHFTGALRTRPGASFGRTKKIAVSAFVDSFEEKIFVSGGNDTSPNNNLDLPRSSKFLSNEKPMVLTWKGSQAPEEMEDVEYLIKEKAYDLDGECFVVAGLSNVCDKDKQSGLLFIRKHDDTKIMTMKQLFEGLSFNKTIRIVLTDLLSKSVFDQYMVDFPVCTYNTLQQTPAFVRLTKTQFPQREEDLQTFEDHFRKCSTNTPTAIAFPSISGKSYIVSPCPVSVANTNFAKDIAEFVRRADRRLVDAFWKEAGNVVDKVFNKSPSLCFRMNTHGHDIAWLHLKFTYLEQ